MLGVAALAGALRSTAVDRSDTESTCGVADVDATETDNVADTVSDEELAGCISFGLKRISAIFCTGKFAGVAGAIVLEADIAGAAAGVVLGIESGITGILAGIEDIDVIPMGPIADVADDAVIVAAGADDMTEVEDIVETDGAAAGVALGILGAGIGGILLLLLPIIKSFITGATNGTAFSVFGCAAVPVAADTVGAAIGLPAEAGAVYGMVTFGMFIVFEEDAVEKVAPDIGASLAEDAEAVAGDVYDIAPIAFPPPCIAGLIVEERPGACGTAVADSVEDSNNESNAHLPPPDTIIEIVATARPTSRIPIES